jgi:intein/homing endonuclease
MQRSDSMKAYNKLSEHDRRNIISSFYNGTEFKNIGIMLDVSDRAVSRVLKEAGVNTKRKNRYTLNDGYFENIDTEVKAYILGLIYADGYVGDNKFNNIVISLKQSDRKLLERIASEIEFTGDIRDSENKSGYKSGSINSILNFSSKQMAEDLRNIGLYPNKSTTMKNMPDIHKDLVRHFIRGYFDGDGCVGFYRNVRTYRQKNGTTKIYEYMKPSVSIVGTKDFLEEMKQHMPIEFQNDDSKHDIMEYIVCSGKKNAIKIYKYLYNGATIYLERKFLKWQKILGACGE